MFLGIVFGCRHWFVSVLAAKTTELMNLGIMEVFCRKVQVHFSGLPGCYLFTSASSGRSNKCRFRTSNLRQSAKTVNSSKSSSTFNNRVLEKQAFDSFFHLVSLHNENVSHFAHDKVSGKTGIQRYGQLAFSAIRN